VDVTSALDASYSQTVGLVAHLGDGDLAAASPCAGWDVRALLNHLLGATWMFTMVNQGQAAGEDAGDVIGADPLLAVTTAATENVASWGRPGGFAGKRSYPFGTFQAQGAAMLNLEEVVVHNWDLARSTGQNLTIDPGLVAMVDAFCRSIPLDEFRAHGAFGPEVESSESASATDRLMALLGRRP
jgi:uncharacterized protein (TIGR03086 family)